MKNLELVYSGKTKDVFRRADGLLEFHFKDDATGYVDPITHQPIFDPGYDTVVGKKLGKGKLSCQLTIYLFELLKREGIPTHYVKTTAPNIMVVRPAKLFVVPGLYNLEFVFRNNAFGSFLRRYPFVQPCQNLHGLVEITTKGKAGQTDYLIVEDALAELGIMKPQEIQEAKKLTKKINDIISKEFERKGLHLVDGKIELGRIGTNDEISLIDDLSFDVTRICKSAVLDGNGNCKNFRECVEKDDKGNIRGKHILKKEEELYEIFGLKK